MPIYDFKCPKCGHLFEKLQKLSDPPPSCDKCKEHVCEKQVSRSSFQLKGGGWYSDGYGK